MAAAFATKEELKKKESSCRNCEFLGACTNSLSLEVAVREGAISALNEISNGAPTYPTANPPYPPRFNCEQSFLRRIRNSPLPFARVQGHRDLVGVH